MSFISRIETKVWAAMAGSGAGATVAGAAVWLLGTQIAHVPFDQAHAQQAIDSVPLPLVALIGLVVTALGAFIAGWNASPSNHAGNNTGEIADDTVAGHGEDDTTQDVPVAPNYDDVIDMPPVDENV